MDFNGSNWHEKPLECMECNRRIEWFRRFTVHWFCAEHESLAQDPDVLQAVRDRSGLKFVAGHPSNPACCLYCNRDIPLLQRLRGVWYCSPKCYEIHTTKPDRFRRNLIALLGGTTGFVFRDEIARNAGQAWRESKGYLLEVQRRVDRDLRDLGLPTTGEVTEEVTAFWFNFANRQHALEGWASERQGREWDFETKTSATPLSSKIFELSRDMKNGSVEFDATFQTGGIGLIFRANENFSNYRAVHVTRGTAGGVPCLRVGLVNFGRRVDRGPFLVNGSSTLAMNTALKMSLTIIDQSIYVYLGDRANQKLVFSTALPKTDLPPAGAVGLYVGHGDRYRLHTGSIKVTQA